jgi:hypothetical protein
MSLRTILLAFLCAMTAPGSTQENQLTFHLDVTRFNRGERDSVIVVATAVNSGSKDLRIWADFEFSGTYTPSAQTVKRFDAIRDSIRATEVTDSGIHHRCRGPRLPFYVVVPNLPSDPLQMTVLRAGESISDTLKCDVYLPDFRQWPGYIELAAWLRIGQNRKGRGTGIQVGSREMRAAIPVP